MKIDKLEVKPWQYALYLIDSNHYYISIPYPVSTMADSRMTIVLNSDEIELMKSNETWLSEFSENVRADVDTYKQRSSSLDVLLEHSKMANK